MSYSYLTVDIMNVNIRRQMLKQVELDKRAIEIYLDSHCSMDEAYDQARAELNSGLSEGFEKIFGAVFRRNK